ncbi:MAG: hypothetical protein F6J94_21675 [Moorea sp. SIO1F2]|uniref:hypothetical protein n=1 Tax=unclassified Moorena TaxID=2683338 RepID=UPI0013B83ECF|nr:MULTISPECIES: hypothetical protein [unclassified Moorena]NEN98903.1 hypothetical protein [Moorena sp. SIO3I7]NEO09356.1 hypothetical protein [Moorena sp. SIO3I8]NEO21739.1 hypothetical protein [Moorena sp. SIO4A5]NEP25369.1 hypothetical protein [Moorena sp. SIO3I6]NEQ57632.1 hypothetical protein [Moorena sp. SIO4A1]
MELCPNSPVISTSLPIGQPIGHAYALNSDLLNRHTDLRRLKGNGLHQEITALVEHSRCGQRGELGGTRPLISCS